jgi:hypothetical protein
MEGFKPLNDLFDCARYHINLRVTCRLCGHSTVLDAAGHWWACHKNGKSEQIAAFVRRLYCKTCQAASGEKRRQSRAG